MFAVTADPIMTVSDAKALMSIADDQQAIFMVNALSAKFKRFCNRVQINQDIDTDIVESLRPYGGDTLHLHAPIWTGTGFTISAAIMVGQIAQTTYTLANGDLQYVTSDKASRIILAGGCWPDDNFGGTVDVTYRGGWAAVPADVIQGAVMQGMVDLKRMKGEVGVTSRGASGESTQFDNAGLVRECVDLWRPYRVMV